MQDGLDVVYIHKIDSLQPIRSWNAIGGTAPLYRVGRGKAIMAADGGRLLEAVQVALSAYTDKTLTDPDALARDLGETALRGYAVDRGEFRQNIFSFGSAITLQDGSVLGARGFHAGCEPEGR
ncbi:MAG: IclR family transcriptional regulator C-terminal domain-containing protein [Pseudomonadota bacterium]